VNARASRVPLPVLLSLAILLVVLLRTAWVSDDAYITFRTIDNFHHGFGLRWNIDERVQTYTHPLWLLVLVVVSRITGSLYYPTVGLSIVLSMSTAWVIATRTAIDRSAAVVAVTVLTFSRAFVDYSTSGLENPLTHLLLAVFFWLYFSEALDRRRSVAMGLIAGLTALNRLDAALLVAPALAMTWIRARRDVWAAAAAAAAPLAVWEVFSLVYYGFPLPNTVYAKLQTGVPASDLVRQGFTYLQNSLTVDPITLTTVMLAGAISIATRRRRDWPVLVGIVASVCFVVRAGGDFMTGRMVSAPLVCAVVVLSRFEWIAGERRALAAWAAAVVVGLAAPHPTVSSTSADNDTSIARGGIADERQYYYPITGLIRTPWRGVWPAPFQAPETVEARRAGRRSVELTQVGLRGFFAGSDMHVIDPLGLGDPLLARLPCEPGWRVGHYLRKVPAGYDESVEHGTDVIEDAALATYYDRLRTITRGPIWSLRRARVILRMNLGLYDDLVRARGR
jgi:arabinofuranosyltransferase